MGRVLLCSAHVLGNGDDRRRQQMQGGAFLYHSTSKGEIVENKQLNLSEPENIMGTMDVNPLLIKLSIPMMISMLVQALYNVVDSIFVARVSENALTAVSLAFSLQNLMFAVGIGTGVGVNALLSKSLGEKNQYRANKTAENGLFLALCSYLVFLVLGLTVVRPYFYAQTSDAAIAEQGIRYLTICCVLSLGMFMQVMNEKLLAATSRTTLSMISQLVGAVVNIILDPIFIFGYCGEALSGTTVQPWPPSSASSAAQGSPSTSTSARIPISSWISRASAPVPKPSSGSTLSACPASPCSAWAA